METPTNAKKNQAPVVAAQAPIESNRQGEDVERDDDDYRALADAHRSSRPSLARGPRDRGSR